MMVDRIDHPGQDVDGGWTYLPVELWETDGGHYALDASRVVFLEIDEVGFDILKLLRRENLDSDVLVRRLPQHPPREIREIHREIAELRRSGYLSRSGFARDPRFPRSHFEKVLSERLSGFTVYITTECNLACSYCIYGGRYKRYPKLGQAQMPWKTAKKMVDFLRAYSSKSESVRLDFFGGEPLLAFDLIERTVDYWKTGIGPGGPETVITVASNGTLLTPRILDFLVKHQATLQVSLDGERVYHDRWRRYRGSGRGSYGRILGNLTRIRERAPRYFREHVKVKSVLTMDDRDMTKAVPFSEPFLKAMHKRGFASLSVEERHYDVARDSRYFDQLHRLGRILLEREGAKDTAALLKPLTPRQRAFYQVTLGQFVDIQAVNRAYQSGRKKVRFRKGCLMGFEDGAVHPNGDISICHKAPSFVIGNVNRGRWDFDKIMEYHDLLVGDWPQCPTCFVQRFCDLCYEKMPGETGGWREARAKFCEFNRTQYRIIIDYMLRILERNPKLWEEFEADVKKTVASASGPPAAPPSI